MSAITAKASRKMKKYAVLTREPRCFLGSFDFSWEQRKVGDLLIERNQQAPMSDEYPLMAFIANEGVAPKGERYDRSALVTDTVNKLYKKTEKGDFIYSSNNLETGSIGLNKYGKACISPVYSIFEPTGIADSNFLGRRLVRKDFINAMVKWRQGVIYGQWRIHESDFLKIEITVPSVEEQRKIGTYLDQLDHLITLHQRKCVFLFGFFQAFISMIFTASTFSWEQRKAKELFVSTADKGYPELPVLSATQDRGMIRRDENSINIFHDKKNEAGYKRVLPGQFVIHLRSFQGGFAHSAIEGITSPAYTVFGFSEPEKHDSEYWKYVFTSKSFIQRLETVTYGIRDGRSISYEEFLTLGFVYPSKAEQTAIARYLDKLSDLITLHQRECISFTARAGRLILTANKKRNTSSWEQRKVSELFRVTRGYVLAATQTETTKTDEKPYPVYSSQTKDKGLMGYYKDYLYEDAITWTTDGANAGTVNYRAGKFYCTNVCGVLLSNEVKANQMIAEALNSVAKGYVSYVGNPKLMNNVMADIVIQIPTQAEEREQLSSFFAKLDNLITLHQRKPFLMKWRTSDANRNQTNRLVL